MLDKGYVINERYEIVSRVGTGGMSDVYKAVDHKLNRNVAIKVLKKEYNTDKSFVSKFKTEAQSAASLIHPNIVNVYDVGEDNGMYYIVMELIEGITLKSYIQKKGSLSSKETVSIAIQIANGIECAHNNQIVHRDIKPQNIMISREGKVKVTDFGIARAASANTMSGTAMGSVHYISPEQAGGQYVDEKSDIYSLGVTMFEMLTGKVPFDGESTVSIALMHIQNSVPSVKEYLDDVPISVEKIIEKCTQNRASNRYPKIALLIADLKRSLVEPDVDFVKIEKVDDTSSTILITNEEAKALREAVEPKKDDDEDDIDVVNPKMDKILTVGGIAVGILALIIIAIIVTVLISGGSSTLPGGNRADEQATTDPNKVEVPNVVGLTKLEAEQTLHKNALGFTYAVDSEFSDEYPKDYVIRQSVDAGKIVDKNSQVSITISKGAEKINVPGDLVGSSLNDATDKLKEIGLDWDIKYEFSNVEIGQVIDCSPAEKAPVNKHDTVRLTVSRGRNSTGEEVRVVPSVVGKTQASAISTLSSSGFAVGDIEEKEDDKVEKGKVIRQIIKAGTRAPEGTSVGLIISKGSEKDGKYSATYTFKKSKLIDPSGKQIKKGVVTVLMNGSAQEINPEYSNVAKWKDDYKYKFYGKKKGTAEIELLVDGKIIITGTVTLR